MKKILSLCIAALLLFGGCTGGIQSPPPDNDGLISPRDTEPTGLEPTVATPSDFTPPAYDTSLYTPSVNEGQYELLVEVKPSVIPMHKVSNNLFISITNLSEEEYRSEFLYCIEQFEGDDWLTLPHSDGWLGAYPLISLKKGESLEKEKQIDAKIVFTPGRYRVKVDDWYGEFEIIPSDPNMISVEFDPNPITLEDFADSGTLVTIRNLSDETYEGGFGVRCIERFDGSEWVAVPWGKKKNVVYLFLILINPGETLNVTCLMADLFDYDFSPGKYRVRYDQWYGEFEII